MNISIIDKHLNRSQLLMKDIEMKKVRKKNNNLFDGTVISKECFSDKNINNQIDKDSHLNFFFQSPR